MTVAGRVLYVGGDFSAIDGQPRRNLAAFELDSGRLLSWHPDPNGVVLAMHVKGARLYLGGRFSEFARAPRSRLAAWDLLADTLSDWAPSADGDILCIESADSSIYLGGRFYTVEDQSRSLLAAVSPVDGHVMTWAPEMARSSPFYHDGGPSVRAIVVRDGAVFVGGAFDLVNQTPCLCLAKLDQRSGALMPWDARWGWFFGGEMPAVTCLRVSGPNLYVAGQFSQLGGRDFGMAHFDRVGFAAALNLTTADATDWDPRLEGPVYAIEVSERGISLGGEFQLGWDWQLRQGLVAMDLRTGLVLDWDAGLDGGVRALAADAQNLYVGGDFSRAAGVRRSGLASFDRASGLLRAWDPAPTGDVWSLCATDSMILVGGNFGAISGATRPYAAAVDPVTAAVLPWDPRPNSIVRDILATDSVVFLGGLFSRISEVFTPGLASVGRRFGERKDFGGGALGSVHKLSLLDTTLYLAGQFSEVDGQPRVGLGAVSARTGHVLPWRADIGPGDLSSDYANSLSATHDAVYVGVPYATALNGGRSHAFALDPQSAGLLGWEPGVNNVVWSVMAKGSSVILGGAFTSAASFPTAGFAVLPAYGRSVPPLAFPTATLSLRQNTPNPAFDLTAVRFSSPALGPAKVELFDLQGRVLDSQSTTLAGNAGEHEVFLRVRGLKPGCYVYRVTAGGESATKRMLVVR